MSEFRLGLINPNASQHHTDAMARTAGAVLPGGSDVVAVTASRGPESIEGYADEVVAAAEVVAMVRETPGLDAYLIACFGDPGLDAARELTSAPVVGIGQAALMAAGVVAKRFVVLATLNRAVPEAQDLVAANGQSSRCVGVLPVHVPVAQQGQQHPETTDVIETVGRKAIEELGAEAVVLGCGPMSEASGEIGARLGVPVCDGVSVGALLAHGLWRAGLRTSKSNAYAPPEDIGYVGMSSLANTP